MDKNKDNKFTPLSDLGEFGLIDHLTKDIKTYHKNTIKGIGDDAAVLDFGDSYIIVTTDLLAEGVHFNLIYTPLKHLGYKAVVVNLSDVYAMNAIPKQITVSMAISAKFSVEERTQEMRLANSALYFRILRLARYVEQPEIVTALGTMTSITFP